MSDAVDETILNDCLDTIFVSTDLSIEENEENCATALQTLGHMYVRGAFPAAADSIDFDPLAITTLLARFQRDAFGMMRYEELLGRYCREGQISNRAHAVLVDELCSIGIRINSRNPRKTRIAAAFSLWFSVMRPLRLTVAEVPGLKERQLMTLGGSCNFWIASQYLHKFGTLELGEGEDKLERIDRIRYDLTVRDLNLSSLEMLYCSTFRPNEELLAEIRAQSPQAVED